MQLPVVDEGPDGKGSGDLRDPRDVVHVIVRGQHVVEPLHSCALRDFQHSLGVPRAHVALCIEDAATIDEERLARRCHEENRVTTFDIDEIDIQCLCGLRADSGDQHTSGKSDRHDEP